MIRLVLFGTLLAGCGGVDCAPGTFKDGDNCVGFDPNDKTPPMLTIDPPGRRSRDPLPRTAAITSDEPATIFVTTDGSDPDPSAATGEESPVTVVDLQAGLPIKYMAVDRAGNASMIETAIYDSDTTPPAPVSAFAIALTNGDAMVTWTNPTDADYAGTMLARVDDLVDVDPDPGATYTTSSPLSPSLQIVAVGTATAFTDPGLPLGPVRYVAWTFDDLGNYSEPVAVRAIVDPGPLAVRFTFTTNGNVLAQTVTTPALDLSATTAQLGGTTLTLNLSVKNLTKAFLANPKAEVTAVTNASFASANGTADGFAFADLGPSSLAPNTIAVKALTFTGVAAGTTATIDLVVGNHPSLMTASSQTNSTQFIDAGSLQARPTFTTSVLGPENRGGRIHRSLYVGEHFVDIPTTHGSIERFDLATGARVSAATLSGGSDGHANVMAVLGNSAREFAFVRFARRRDSGPIEIVRLNEGLKETGRLELQLSDNRGFSHPGISADGKLLAVPVIGGVALVDTTTMTLVDADPSTPTIDLVDPGFTTPIRSATFFDGTNGLVVVSRSEGKAAMLKKVQGVYTIAKLQVENPGTRGHGCAVGPDGRVWLAFETGLRIYDPATDTVTNSTYPSQPSALRLVGTQIYAVRTNRQTVDVFDAAGTGAVLRTFTLPNGNAIGHWLEAATR